MISATKGTKIAFDYVNWQGVQGHRRAKIEKVMFGSTEYHPEAEWLMEAWDLDKEAVRFFAMKDMANVKEII